MYEINARTKQLGIIGCPVEHSFSPKMHNFISRTINSDYTYSAWRVEPEMLQNAISGMRALNISGINVTAPHKAEITKYLDVISDDARMLGSVNTVVNRNGKLYGYNTDSDGFYTSLAKSGIEVKNKNILIFGAGGVVKPTLIRLIKESPQSVTVLNRTKSKTALLKRSVNESVGFDIDTDFGNKIYDIVINTTSAGMEPQENALPTDSISDIRSLDFITSSTAAIDMIYNPDKTRFLKEAEKRGAKILNGLGMLIYQGLLSYELFTGIKLPDDMAEKIKREVFGR